MKTLSLTTVAVFAFALVLGASAFAEESVAPLAGPSLGIVPSATTSGITIDPSNPAHAPLPHPASSGVVKDNTLLSLYSERDGQIISIVVGLLMLVGIIYWAVKTAEFHRTHPETMKPESERRVFRDTRVLW